MRKLIATTALSLFTSAALASGGYAAGVIGIGGAASGYSGEASGYTSGSSTGGSQAISNNYGTGFSLQASGSETNGYAYAGGGVAGDHAYSLQGGNSNSVSYAGGIDLGNAYGQSAAGGGTDYSANSFSSFQMAEIGGGFVVGGFAGFDTFTW